MIKKVISFRSSLGIREFDIILGLKSKVLYAFLQENCDKRRVLPHSAPAINIKLIGV
jgi:septum formation inhibitor-activating ATPase MinD